MGGTSFGEELISLRVLVISKVYIEQPYVLTSVEESSIPLTKDRDSTLKVLITSVRPCSIARVDAVSYVAVAYP